MGVLDSSFSTHHTEQKNDDNCVPYQPSILKYNNEIVEREREQNSVLHCSYIIQIYNLECCYFDYRINPNIIIHVQIYIHVVNASAATVVVVTSNHHGIMMMVVIFPQLLYIAQWVRIRKKCIVEFFWWPRIPKKSVTFTEDLATLNHKVAICVYRHHGWCCQPEKNLIISLQYDLARL